MDFIYLPGRRSAVGIPVMHAGTWIIVFIIFQVIYYTCYTVSTMSSYRALVDPFECLSSPFGSLYAECVSSGFVILTDWSVATMSIVAAFVANELLDEAVCLAYHYTYYVKVFMFFRIAAFLILLPMGGVPVYIFFVIILAHLIFVGIVARVVIVLWGHIEQNRVSIAIQFNFRFFSVEAVKVHKSVDGQDLKLSSSITSRDICPICFDTLLVQSCKPVCDSERVFPRFNASFKRTRVFGNVEIFKTKCNHSFHRDCLMKWISGKPIRVDLSAAISRRRDGGARCPVCGCDINLKITRHRRNIFQLVFNTNSLS